MRKRAVKFAALGILGLVTLGLVTLGLASCGGAQKKTMSEPQLEPYECGTVERVHVFGEVFLASQPQPEDFQHASDGGIKTVVNLRKPDEVEWDEEAVVTGLGMEYHSVPYKAVVELTDEVFDEVRELLNAPGNKPLMLHCSSGNRVAAVWIAHRVLDDGVSFEVAEAEAKEIGLKLPAYANRAKQYTETRQGN